jgi:hypothetical protein
MKAERTHCLRINAPEWYARPDFMAWLNGERRATWHERGEGPTEYSDVFITFDAGEGSDYDTLMPEDIWQQIARAATELGVRDCIVWISNVGEASPTGWEEG